MQVTSEQTDPCTVILDIVVDEQQVARTFDASYRAFSRGANVPGFRPGKAPRVIVERYVDSERVRKHALEQLVRATYAEAVAEADVRPYAEPEFQFGDLEDKRPYTYKATIALEPKVTVGPYTGLEVIKPVYTVNETMVDARVESIREERTRLERVKDRGVEPNDVLIVENKVVLDGEEAEETPMRRQLLQLGNNIPGLDDALIGMEPGEERVFELSYPDDFDEPDRRGKHATFTVKLSSISARRVPELNDDFASAVAGVSSVEELRSTLREQLAVDVVRASNSAAEEALIGAILKDSEIFYPTALLKQEVETKLRSLASELEQNRTTYAQYLAHRGQTVEEHQSRLAADADAQIRLFLILNDIVTRENLRPSQEAVDAHFVKLLEDGVLDEERYDEYHKDPQRRASVTAALAQEALHDFLFANNIMTEVVVADGSASVIDQAEVAPNVAGPDVAAPNDAAPNDAAPNDAAPNDAAPNDATRVFPDVDDATFELAKRFVSSLDLAAMEETLLEAGILDAVDPNDDDLEETSESAEATPDVSK